MTGRTTSTERYAVFFKPSLVTFKQAYVYADPTDKFERPPLWCPYCRESAT